MIRLSLLGVKDLVLLSDCLFAISTRAKAPIYHGGSK